MYGALIGDIVGSRFEFHPTKRKDFYFFGAGCGCTDDSVMTMAVAKALLQKTQGMTMEEWKQILVREMKAFGAMYPNAGYGGRFRKWLKSEKADPYGSYGNGSAMRVSPVGWWENTLEQTEQLAAASAEVTHNHPEGIKGAVVVAGSIFLARTGHSKEELRKYMEQFYPLDFTLEEIRPSYEFYETCQQSVPESLEAFLEADSFEEAVRNAVSLGGDSDTMAAIAGSIAEAFYGIPEALIREAEHYLNGYQVELVRKFQKQSRDRIGETTDRKKPQNNSTEMVLILDRSGSMSGLESDTIGGFNGMIEKQKKQEGTCLVSTVLFDTDTKVLHDRVPLQEIPKMTDRDYCVGGCTALLDALGGAIHHVTKVHKYIREEDVPEHVIFVVITDGMENASRKFTSEKVKEMIEDKKKLGWEFLFIGANIDAVETANRFGISENRAVNYQCDRKGTKVLFESLSNAFGSVRNGNAMPENWSEDIREDYEQRK